MALRFLNSGYFAGKVGIGTETPQAQLTLLTTMASSPTTQIYLDVDGNNAVGGGCEIIFNTSASGGTLANYNAKITGTRSSANDGSSDLSFFTTLVASADSPAVRMTIKDNGNVGIGDTTPEATLTVKKGSEGAYFSAGGDTANNRQLVFTSSNGNGSNGAKHQINATSSNGIIALATANVDRLTVGNTGNVGIGTTDPPAYKLDVSGSANNADIGIRIINTFDDNDPASEPNSVLFLNAASNNGYLRVHGAPANTASKHQIDLGSTASDSFLTFSPGGEKMRITHLGGISFGSTGTAYGTSGQVLTSAGDASPTWETPTTGTVTGTGAVNQVAFWDGTSSLSGDNSLYWDPTNEHLGIGDSTPGSKLKVLSGINETSICTVDISHIRNDADVATNAMRINMDLSGADTTTADRTNSGLFLDLDSSADGDASNEHRIRGISSDVRFTGFSDSVQSGYFLAESNNSTEKTALLIGLQAQASHDSSSTNGGVSNMYGVYGVSSIQDLGDVDNSFGGLFATIITASRGAANVGITKGVEGRVTIDKAETITYNAMTAVSGIIDNNEGTIPTFGAQYLFKGDYQGTKGDNAYGIYTEGNRHYFDGNIGIGTTNATSRLTVQENGITAKIATVTIGDTIAGASLTLRGGSPTIYFDRTGTDPENKILMDSAGLEFKTGTLDAEGDVDFKITAGGDLQLSKGAKISNQENTDIDSAAAEVVAEVAISYTAAFFDFVVKKGTNVRSGTVYACHDGTNVEFTETSTNDLGDTSDVTLSVDKTSTNLRLIATVTSDDWSVKSLIRAI
jgi:hypothetical protein